MDLSAIIENKSVSSSNCEQFRKTRNNNKPTLQPSVKNSSGFVTSQFWYVCLVWKRFVNDLLNVHTWKIFSITSTIFIKTLCFPWRKKVMEN